MKITATKITNVDEIRIAAGATLQPGKESQVDFAEMLQCEHSPIRTQLYKLEMIGIPTFVSVHLVRHKYGVDHFVTSNRDDRGVKDVDRNTPVNHTMYINAQALITMARKRLCWKSHNKTVGIKNRICKAIKKVDPVMASFMVPECVYRNGLCPEVKMCRFGVTDVCSWYPKWPGHRVIL